jgi:hypothetical protein
MAHEDDVALIRWWFHCLAQHMQAVDYIGARPLFAENVIAFGSFASFLTGREALEREQWRKVWGTTGLSEISCGGGRLLLSRPWPG